MNAIIDPSPAPRGRIDDRGHSSVEDRRRAHRAQTGVRGIGPGRNMTHPTIGIIGGSGLYDMAELTDCKEEKISTPFGDPSGPYVLGTLRGKRVAFLARHGAGHRILPSELNFRANIYGFKVLGVERIVSEIG